MSEKSDFRHLGASEFPNDNPLLHDGAIWVCFAPCGPLRPVVRPRASGRSSTIPAPPLEPASRSEQPVAPALELIRPPAIEVATETTPAAALPSAPPELQSTSAAATLAEDGPHIESAHGPPSSGCSLSAGHVSDEPSGPDPTVSEMRERSCVEAPVLEIANDDSVAAPPFGQVPAEPAQELEHPCEQVSPVVLSLVDVECSPKSSEDETLAPVAADDSAARMTILPPPSEDGGAHTLTLARIRVSGRSIDVVFEAAPPAEAQSESPAAVEGSVESPPTEQDPFAAFVAALVDVAMASGATRAAAVLPGLLDGNAENLSAFPELVRSSIVSAGIVSDVGGTLAPSASFTTTSNAWRMVLRGESNDFSACGTSTLDGWAAELLKAFGIGRDGRPDVRRELRRRGVAAFGMILAA